MTKTELTTLVGSLASFALSVGLPISGLINERTAYGLSVLGIVVLFICSVLYFNLSTIGAIVIAVPLMYAAVVAYVLRQYPDLLFIPRPSVSQPTDGVVVVPPESPAIPTAPQVEAPVTPPLPPASNPQNAQSSDLFSSRITPEFLTKLFDGRPASEARELAEAYTGWPMTISGEFFTIKLYTISTDNRPVRTAVVTVKPAKSSPGIWTVMPACDFEEKWIDRLLVLMEGDRLVIKGKIRNISPMSLLLDSCELVEVTGPG